MKKELLALVFTIVAVAAQAEGGGAPAGARLAGASKLTAHAATTRLPTTTAWTSKGVRCWVDPSSARGARCSDDAPSAPTVGKTKVSAGPGLFSLLYPDDLREDPLSDKEGEPLATQFSGSAKVYSSKVYGN